MAIELLKGQMKCFYRYQLSQSELNDFVKKLPAALICRSYPVGKKPDKCTHKTFMGYPGHHMNITFRTSNKLLKCSLVICKIGSPLRHEENINSEFCI